MNNDFRETSNLIQFPPRLRVVPTVPASVSLPAREPALIEHDGRMYDLAALVRQLSPRQAQEIDAAAPRSGQDLWDEVARRWPALAAEIVAGARPTG